MDLEVKAKWCMDMFHILDEVLHEFMFMVHPKMQKQDAQLELEEGWDTETLLCLQSSEQNHNLSV